MLASRHPAQEWAALDNARYYAAARLATRGWSVGGPLRRVAFAFAHPHLIPNYVQLLRRLPLVLLQLTATPVGNLLFDRWHTQSWRRAASHAVLTMPATPQAYMRGRRRQAVRTNLHHAAALNLVCRRVDPDWEWIKEGVASEPFNDLVSQVDDGVHDQGFVQSWAVFDASNDELGRAVVVVDELTAVLLLLAGPPDLAVAHQTRYLLHTTLVRDLIEQGVRHLVVESILGAPAGHKYFAARLGYRACRMKVEQVSSRRLIDAEPQDH
jgi:hypothetical protein